MNSAVLSVILVIYICLCLRFVIDSSLLVSWDEFTKQMREIVECISIEEKSDIKKDLEVIREYHVSDTRDITMAQEKENAIRRVAEDDCENFWEFCKFMIRDYVFRGKYNRTTFTDCEYVYNALGENLCKAISNAEDLKSVQKIMIDRACYYLKLSIELRKRRDEDLSPNVF